MVKGNKRLKNESFKAYRARLKEEKQRIKQYLKGTFFHISKKYAQTPTGYVPLPGITYRRYGIGYSSG